MEPVYRYYPWKSLLKTGTNGVATSEYGRKLMHDIMMIYNGDQKDMPKSQVMVLEYWQKQWKLIFHIG